MKKVFPGGTADTTKEKIEDSVKVKLERLIVHAGTNNLMI